MLINDIVTSFSSQAEIKKIMGFLFSLLVLSKDHKCILEDTHLTWIFFVITASIADIIHSQGFNSLEHVFATNDIFNQVAASKVFSNRN